MRKHSWLLVSAICAAALPWAACGGNNSSSGGNGGTSTSTSSHASSSSGKASTSSTSSSSSSTSGGGSGGGGGGSGTGGACAGGPFDPMACEPCIEMNCCDAAAACYADTDCNSCVMGMPTNANTCNPGVTPKWDALFNCAAAKCNSDCAVLDTCNPVTNAPCNTAMGEQCDLGGGFYNDVYECFPPPNDAMLCGMCDNSMGPYCGPGLHCVEDNKGMNGKCGHFCCDDGDCGGGVCDKSSLPGNVGVCVNALDAGVDPTCDVDGGGPPAMSPSNGSCFTIPGMPGGDAGAG